MNKKNIITAGAVLILLAIVIASSGANAQRTAQLQADHADGVQVCGPGSVFTVLESGGVEADCVELEEPTPTEAPTETETAMPTDTELPTETVTDEPTHAHTETATNEPTNTATNTQTVTPSRTITPSQTGTASATPSQTRTPTRTPTRIPTLTSVFTLTPSRTPTITATRTQPSSGFIAPFPAALQCPDIDGDGHEDVTDSGHYGLNSDRNLFHTGWNGVSGCYYDHEHGVDPYTPELANAFPGMDLYALMGNSELGGTNPSSDTENTHKHGGFKWDVDLAAPQGCLTGFEDGTVAVNRYAIQLHSFSPQEVEHASRNHSSVALLALCKDGNSNDLGYIYVAQLQEFGQRVMQYQGFRLEYPNDFPNDWPTPRGPYVTHGCFGPPVSMPAGMSDLNGGAATEAVCRPSLADVIARMSNAPSIWSSKPTGCGSFCDETERPETPRLFKMLFRVRDGTQLQDSNDMSYPYTFRWICSTDGGLTFNAGMRNSAGRPSCKWNNSTHKVHEVMGDIPASWESVRLPNGQLWDQDPRPGRITATGFVTRFGVLNLSCTAASVANDCYPIKMISAFVGRYSSDLCLTKCSNVDFFNTPERDIYFCNGVVCKETDAGAVPSGWIGSEN